MKKKNLRALFIKTALLSKNTAKNLDEWIAPIGAWMLAALQKNGLGHQTQAILEGYHQITRW